MTTPKSLLDQLDFSRLRKLRVSRGFSAYQIAKATKSNNGHVTAIERGEVPNPGVGILLTLADFYEMDISELLKYCARK